jgi:hypothetical protein
MEEVWAELRSQPLGLSVIRSFRAQGHTDPAGSHNLSKSTWLQQNLHLLDFRELAHCTKSRAQPGEYLETPDVGDDERIDPIHEGCPAWQAMSL